MSMSMVLRSVCFVSMALIFAFHAQAQNAAKGNDRAVKKAVLVDTRTRVGSIVFLHPDCTSSGKATIRVTREPKKGKSEVATAMDFPSFPPDNVRSKCNSHRVEATQVWYTPETGFKGRDSFEYEMIGPAGQYRRTRVDVDVK